MRWTLAGESILALAAATLVASGGCLGPLEAPLATAHPDETTPRRGGVLHLATTIGDVTTLDPATSSDSFGSPIVRMLYAGLVDFDPQGRVVPDLATTIDGADEGRTYRFTLREGVRFHDGNEVTAADVKRSLERALHPSTPSAFASMFEDVVGFAEFGAKKAERLEGVVAEGRYVVAIHLKERDATFLQLLALPLGRVTCPSAGDRYSPAWGPCGAGPFKLLPGGWERGRTLTLVRNDDYFRPGVPYLDAVTWQLGATQIAEGYRFFRGQLDVVGDLTQADTVRFQSDPRWQPLGAYDPALQVSGDAMNTEVPPFDNIEIRRAVAAAINRDHIVLLRNANLAPMTKPVPELPGYDPPSIGQTHDLAAALEHMQKAGYAFDPATGRGGWPATIAYDAVRQTIYEQTGLSIQQDLAKIGIRIELRLSSFGTWSAITHRRRRSAMSPQGWKGDFPDPSNFLESRFATESIADEDGSNYAFYSNARVDTLLARAKRELDSAERTRLYAEVERILCDEAPWAFEYSFRFYRVRQPYVRGFQTHAVWTTDVVPIWIDRAPDLQGRRDAPLTRQLLGSLVGEAR